MPALDASREQVVESCSMIQTMIDSDEDEDWDLAAIKKVLPIVKETGGTRIHHIELLFKLVEFNSVCLLLQSGTAQT